MSETKLRLGLPKGRMESGVMQLLSDAGIQILFSQRQYRPRVTLNGYDVKILKPQNIVEMLAEGSREIGFVGADLVEEKGAEVVELLDTGLDPVTIVLAAPETLLHEGKLPDRELRIATEYVNLASKWIEEERISAKIIRSYGATEVFPPEDADAIIDNTSTGSTLAANGLSIVRSLKRSTTRLYANPKALDIPEKRERIEQIVLLLQSILEARGRVMLELNVPAERLEAVVNSLPAMREPTISQLHGSAGYAVKVAAPKASLPDLIPAVKRMGGTDIVVSTLSQIVP